MKHLAILVILAAALPSVAIRADGLRLMSECGELMDFVKTGELKADSAGVSFCLGLVNGMIGLNTLYQRRVGPESALFCPPEAPVTNAEGARIVYRYLQAHPEMLDQDDISLAYYAFAEAFPCP